MTYYDQRAALLDRRAFVSKRVFAQEASAIFRSSWICVGPADWAAAPGDFYTSYIGPEPVVVWRTPAGTLSVFANRCPFGVAPLATTGRGQATEFVCSCHRRLYRPSDLAGLSADHCASFRGLVFALRRGPTESLADELGNFASYLPVLLGADVARFALDEPLRWQVRANWKVIIEAWCAPIDPVAHEGQDSLGLAAGFQAATETGVAAFEGEPMSGDADDPLSGLRPVAGVLFPNLAFDPAAGALHICQPLGPELSEIHSFPLEPPAGARHRAWLPLGPGAEGRSQQISAWEATTAGSRGLVARRWPLNLQRGLGAERAMNLPGAWGELFSEANARAFFAWWQSRLAPSEGGGPVIDTARTRDLPPSQRLSFEEP